MNKLKDIFELIISHNVIRFILHISCLIGFALLVMKCASAATPDQILQQNGYTFLTTDRNKKIYYRTREVKRRPGGVVWYSTTEVMTNNGKHGLKSYYTAMLCKEERVVTMGIHTVPFVGKATYKDFTKDGIKESDLKVIKSVTDKAAQKKFCK